MDKDLSINQVNQIKLNIVNVKRRAWLYAYLNYIIYITYTYTMHAYYFMEKTDI